MITQVSQTLKTNAIANPTSKIALHEKQYWKRYNGEEENTRPMR